MKTRGLRTLLLLIALTGQTVFGCASQQPVSVRERFEGIQVGMPRSEVEARLGHPVLCYNVHPLVVDEEAWYLPPPQIGLVDAPWGPGSICVRYTIDGRVASKDLNPQCQERKNMAA